MYYIVGFNCTNMRVRTIAVLYLIMAIYFIMTVAAEVFVDDFVKPSTMFGSLLLGTLITSFAALTINIDIPSDN